MHKTAEFFSLLLSAPTIFLCIMVVILWMKAALDAWKFNGKMDGRAWFITGVFCGFIGEALDNIYWLFPWSALFLGLPISNDLFTFGVYPNIPFRQLAGSFAAYCHIRAHFTFDGAEDNPHNRLLKISIIVGFLYSGGLVIARWLLDS